MTPSQGTDDLYAEYLKSQQKGAGDSAQPSGDLYEEFLKSEPAPTVRMGGMIATVQRKRDGNAIVNEYTNIPVPNPPAEAPTLAMSPSVVTAKSPEQVAAAEAASRTPLVAQAMGALPAGRVAPGVRAAERFQQRYGELPASVGVEEDGATVTVGRPQPTGLVPQETIARAKAGELGLNAQIQAGLSIERKRNSDPVGAAGAVEQARGLVPPDDLSDLAVNTFLNGIAGATPFIGGVDEPDTERKIDEYVQAHGPLKEWEANFLATLRTVGAGVGAAATMGSGSATSRAPSGAAAVAGRLGAGTQATEPMRRGALKAIEDVARAHEVHPSAVAKLVAESQRALVARIPALRQGVAAGAKQFAGEALNAAAPSAITGAVVGGASSALAGERDPVELAKDIARTGAEWGLFGAAMHGLSAEAQFDRAYRSMRTSLERSASLRDAVAAERMGKTPQADGRVVGTGLARRGPDAAAPSQQAAPSGPPRLPSGGGSAAGTPASLFPDAVRATEEASGAFGWTNMRQQVAATPDLLLQQQRQSLTTTEPKTPKELGYAHRMLTLIDEELGRRGVPTAAPARPATQAPAAATPAAAAPSPFPPEQRATEEAGNTFAWSQKAALYATYSDDVLLRTRSDVARAEATNANPKFRDARRRSLVLLDEEMTKRGLAIPPTAGRPGVTLDPSLQGSEPIPAEQVAQAIQRAEQAPPRDMPPEVLAAGFAPAEWRKLTPIEKQRVRMSAGLEPVPGFPAEPPGAQEPLDLARQAIGDGKVVTAKIAKTLGISREEAEQYATLLREEREAAKPGRFSELKTRELLTQLADEQRRLEQELDAYGKGQWARFDDDIQATVSGGSRAGGRAWKQAQFTQKRIDELTARLKERGFDDEGIAQALSDPEAAAERAALAGSEPVLGSDAFQFGDEEPDPWDIAASEPPAADPVAELEALAGSEPATQQADIPEDGKSAPAIDPESRYADEEDPEALFAAGLAEMRQHRIATLDAIDAQRTAKGKRAKELQELSGREHALGVAKARELIDAFGDRAEIALLEQEREIRRARGWDLDEIQQAQLAELTGEPAPKKGARLGAKKQRESDAPTGSDAEFLADVRRQLQQLSTKQDETLAKINRGPESKRQPLRLEVSRLAGEISRWLDRVEKRLGKAERDALFREINQHVSRMEREIGGEPELAFETQHDAHMVENLVQEQDALRASLARWLDTDEHERDVEQKPDRIVQRLREIAKELEQAGADPVGSLLVAPNAGTPDLIVIPCGSEKQESGTHPALDLYTGQYFRKALAYAEAIMGEAGRTRIRILSAKHGFVRLFQELQPYDVKMGDADAITAEQLVAQAKENGEYTGNLDVRVIGGKQYVAQVAAVWPNVRRVLPEGLGIGEQKAALAKLTARLTGDEQASTAEPMVQRLGRDPQPMGEAVRGLLDDFLGPRDDASEPTAEAVEAALSSEGGAPIDADWAPHRLFDDPEAKVRLLDKVRQEHGNPPRFLTIDEAKARIAGWKKHALAQGGDPRNSQKVVLSLFDLTGTWAQPWIDAGYQVYTFDIQRDPEMEDVNKFSAEFFNDSFSMFDGMDIHAILAAVPCTDFANSGAKHFAAKDADGRTAASIELARQTLRTIEYLRPAVWAVENPVGRIEKLTGLPPWRLAFDPYQLGDPYTKKTLLWGRFNADLPVAPVDPVEGSKMHQKYGGSSQRTKNARSVTPEGFAYAFFMANNAIDHPALALQGKYDRLDKQLVADAVKAGLGDDEFRDLVDDHYYFDENDQAAEQALRDAIAKGQPAVSDERRLAQHRDLMVVEQQRIEEAKLAYLKSPEMIAESVQRVSGYLREQLERNPERVRRDLAARDAIRDFRIGRAPESAEAAEPVLAVVIAHRSRLDDVVGALEDARSKIGRGPNADRSVAAAQVDSLLTAYRERQAHAKRAESELRAIVRNPDAAEAEAQADVRAEMAGDPQPKKRPRLGAKKAEPQAALEGALTPYDTPEIIAARAHTEANKDRATHRITTPEREADRRAWTAAHFTKVMGEARKRGLRHERQAVILIGNAGSGKTTVAGDVAADYYGAAIFDTDDAKRFIPEYENGKGSQLVYVEAGTINKTARALAIADGANIVVPLAGYDPAGIPGWVRDELLAKGYTVHVRYVHVPVEVAAQRAVDRYLGGGHFLDPALILKHGEKPRQTYDAVRALEGVRSDAEIDNSGKRGEHRVVYNRGARELGADVGTDAGRGSDVRGGRPERDDAGRSGRGGAAPEGSEPPSALGGARLGRPKPTGPATDLFGNPVEVAPSELQGGLFSPSAGTEASRPLASAEGAARAELGRLRAELAVVDREYAESRTQSDRMRYLPQLEKRRAEINGRIAELEKLVNRGEKITADELATRAGAETASVEPPAPAPVTLPADAQAYVDRLLSGPKRTYARDYATWLAGGKQGQAPMIPSGMQGATADKVRQKLDKLVKVPTVTPGTSEAELLGAVKLAFAQFERQLTTEKMSEYVAPVRAAIDAALAGGVAADHPTLERVRPVIERHLAQHGSRPRTDTTPTVPQLVPEAPKIQTLVQDVGSAASAEEIAQLVAAAQLAVQENALPTSPKELREWAGSIIGRPYESGTWQMDDVYDAIEGAVNVWMRDHTDPIATNGWPQAKSLLGFARELEEKWFRGRLRSAGILERQQFSTPLPLSYAAAYAVNVVPGEKVLEPTAGTGNLVNGLWGSGAVLHLNELDPRRAAVLRAIGHEPTMEDALRLPLTGRRYNAVVMNPPYGAYHTGKYAGQGALPFPDGDVWQRFVYAALQSTVEGGRIAAVLPPNALSTAGKGFKQWLNQHHTPVAWIRSPDGAYEGRGTDIGTVLLVVDKGKGQTTRGRVPEGGYVPFQYTDDVTWAQWFSAMEEFSPLGRLHRQTGHAPAADVAGIAPRPSAAVTSKTEAPLVERAPEGGANERGGEPAGIAGSGVAGRPGGAPGVAGGRAGGSGPDVASRPGSGDQPGPVGGAGLVAPSAPGDGRAAAPAPAPGVVSPVPRGRVEPAAGDSAQRRAEIEAANDSPVFTPYALGTRERRASHPRLVVETRAMAGMPAPPLTTTLQSPYVTAAWGRDGAQGGISDEQADQILRITTAWQKGHGFLVADDVGVGKAREAAGAALEAIAQGATRLLYMTKNEVNVIDAMREFRAVASGSETGDFPATFVVVGDYKGVKTGAQSLPQPPGPVIYIAHSYNFAAYADALREVNLDTLLADEAHEYKNLFAARGMAWTALHKQMLQRPNSRFAYFTATPGVTLDELGYLFGLREWPVGGFADWIARKTGLAGAEDTADARNEEVEAVRADLTALGERGDEAQAVDDVSDKGKKKFMRGRDVFQMRVTPAETEQVMRELKGAGKYMARDLWRGGVAFDVHEVDLTGDTPEAAAARARYDEAAALVRDITLAAQKYGRMNKKVKTAGLDRALIQSYMKQLLFDLRLPTVLRLADEALAKGQQVVISVHSIGGDAESEVGLSEADAALPANKRLESAINRINTQHIEKEGSGAEAEYVDLGEIPEALMVVSELRDRLARLTRLVDPVRRIEEHFGPKKVATITGSVTAKRRKALMGEFQAGVRPVAMISRAGKVGISLHDTNGRPRRMIVADYEWSADIFKQELGRVDRTGQRSNPHVTLVATTIAGERKFAATIAARMSSLGATSKGSAEATGTDALDQFDVQDAVALLAMKETYAELARGRSDLTQYFTGSKFFEWQKDEETGTYERIPKRRLDEIGMRDFLLDLMMFPVGPANEVFQRWADMREALRSGASVQEAAARRTGRLHGELTRTTPLNAPADPALVLYDVENAEGERKGIVQGFVTHYIREIQEARGFDESGGTKSRRYVQFTTTDGQLISGLELNAAEARRVRAHFGKGLRTTITPDEAWSDLHMGEKVQILGPNNTPFTLHRRKDDKIQIGGATLSKHGQQLRGLAAYSQVGNFLFIEGTRDAFDKLIARFPLAQPTGGAVRERGPAYGAASVAQTETPAFRRWFGDSKVVDDAGRPLVVYHGTPARFDTFRTPAYFAEDRAMAEEFGDAAPASMDATTAVIPVYLSIQNPKILTDFEEFVGWGPRTIERLKAEGYDGAILLPAHPDEQRMYAVLSPEQIKSATDNDGSFDPANPSMVREPVVAYHGTPHRTPFPRFSLQKIGTGEGAQAFGWGLYFATRKDIAAHYRDLRGRWLGIIPKGRMYHVDLPDDRTMLDWDRPLYKQPRVVQDAVRAILGSVPEGDESGRMLYATLVEQIRDDFSFFRHQYPEIMRAMFGPRADIKNGLDDRFLDAQEARTRPDEFASRLLAQHGVTGIRFLDGPSRPKGKGTYNYVIFDDRLIRIRSVREAAAAYAAIPQPWYSRLARAIEAGPNKATAAQWRAQLSKNVAKGEREWTGVERLLALRPEGTITKADVLAAFYEGEIRLKEHVLSDFTDSPEHERVAELERQQKEAEAAGDEFRVEELAAEIERIEDEWSQRAEPEYGGYTEYGGANYREILLVLDKPARKVRKVLRGSWQEVRQNRHGDRMWYRVSGYGEWDNIAFPSKEAAEAALGAPATIEVDDTGDSFSTGHFQGEANILVHVRLKTRTRRLPDGTMETVLFVEEIQSDWHQQGRDYGYRDPEAARALDERLAAADRRRQEAHHAQLRAADEINELQRKHGTNESLQQHPEDLARWNELHAGTAARQRALDETRAEVEALQRERRAASGRQVPDAPMKQTEEWVGLAIRRIFAEAVKIGATSISWATGAQQQRRFDLSTHVDRIEWELGERGDVVALSGYAEDDSDTGSEWGRREVLFDEQVSREKLADYVGKAMAQKIEAAVTAGEQKGSFEGDDLKIGGHGMEGFYDKMLPILFRNELKALGFKGMQLEPFGTEVEAKPFTLQNFRSGKTFGRYATRAEAEAARADAYSELVVVEDKLYEDAELAENPSFRLPAGLAEKITAEGQRIMERLTAKGDEADVAFTQAQRAEARRMLAALRKAGFPVLPDRVKGVQAAKARDLGAINVVGQSFATKQDAALLLQALRHPAMEIFSVFYIDEENRILGHDATTSGALYYSVLPDAYAILTRARQLGAKGLLLGHNHPSGDPTPSQDDRAVTAQYAKVFGGLGLDVVGQVIINHDTASWIDRDGTSSVQDVKFAIPADRSASWRPGALPLRGPRHAAELLAEASGPESVTVAFLDTQHQIVAVAQQPKRALAGAALETWLPKAVQDAAAKAVVIVVPEGHGEALARRVYGRVGVKAHWADAVLDVMELPDAGFKHGSGSPRYVSYAEQGFVDTAFERNPVDDTVAPRALIARESEPRGWGEDSGEARPRLGRLARVSPKHRVAKHDRTPLAAFPLPEAEQRWQAAKGVRPQPWATRFREAVEAAKKLTRHFPEIDPARSPFEATVHELLLEYERAPAWAQAVAYNELARITEGLAPNEVDLLGRALVLPDLQKDIEAGLYDGRPESVPFFGTEGATMDEVSIAIARAVVEVDGALARRPKVQAALDARAAFVQQLTREMVEADLLPADVLEDPRYYHRQVMLYVNAAAQPVAGRPRQVRNRLRGFQRGRVGGSDFNTKYEQAEFEWVAQALTELKTHRTLDALKTLADRTAALKREAKALNIEALGAKVRAAIIAGEAAPELDEGVTTEDFLDDVSDYELGQTELKPFATKIAIAMGRLSAAYAKGAPVPPGFEGLIEAMLAAREQWKDTNADRKAMDLAPEPFSFEHPRWWAFLQAVASMQGDHDVIIAARTIFKAIADRNRFIQEALGPAFINDRPQSRDDYKALAAMAPEGYTTWQPQEGNHFFKVQTVEQRALELVLAGEKPLTEDDLRTAAAMGGVKETWIVPEWLAKTLDQFKVQPVVPGALGALDRFWVRMAGHWKQYILHMPLRALKYNFNNISGDADAALAYAPGIFREVPGAARDLWTYMFRRTAPEGMTRVQFDRQMEELTRLGIVDAGLTAIEIPDVNDLPAFQRLAEQDPHTFMGFLLQLGPKYFEVTRGLAQYRENILRLAAYRYLLPRVQAGERLFVASNPARIEGTKPRTPERAALLARDLIGDYQAVSGFAQVTRQRVLLFFSFQEINFKRYVRMLRNIPLEGGGGAGGGGGNGRGPGAAGAAADGGGARRLRIGGVIAGRPIAFGAKRLLKINLYFLAVALWNATMFPDEDEELRRSGRGLHIIWGRAPSGEILSTRIEGSWADFLEWLALSDYPEDVRDVLSGEATVGEKLTDAAKAPVNKIVQLWEPFTKQLFEQLTKKTTYPDAFRTRPIRDRGEHLAGMLALQHVYNAVTGKPARKGDWLTSMFIYRTDPGEAAYWDVKEQVAKYLDAQGKPRGAAEPTERANALYYWKRAVQWEDEKAAAKWRQRYLELGGSARGASQSVRLGSPLGGLTRKDRRAFLKTLSPSEREILTLAEQWYERIYGDRAMRLRGPARDTTSDDSPLRRLRLGGR